MSIYLDALDHEDRYFENLVLALLPVIGTTDTIRILARELDSFYYRKADYGKEAYLLVQHVRRRL